MEENEISAVLKKELQPKAPKELKETILKQINRLAKTQTLEPFNPIESFIVEGIILVLLVFSSSFLFVKKLHFGDSLPRILEKINTTTIELFILTLTVVFILSVLDQLLNLKSNKFSSLV